MIHTQCGIYNQSAEQVPDYKAVEVHMHTHRKHSEILKYFPVPLVEKTLVLWFTCQSLQLIISNLGSLLGPLIADIKTYTVQELFHLLSRGETEDSPLI